MAITDLLRSCPLFFELYDSEVEKIVQYCTVFSYAPDQAIVHEGDEGNQIFILLNGTAEIRRSLHDGQFMRFGTLKPGDVFGEMVLVDERTRSADVVALGDCDILEVKYDDIFSIFAKEPKIFGLIMLNLSRLLTKRLKQTNQTIQDLRSGRKVA